MIIAPESEVSRMHSRGAAVAVAAFVGIGLATAVAPTARAQTLTTLYSFCAQGGTGCTDGASPVAGLVQDSDGNFYGTTENGGANGGGTVFKVTPSGALTTLYSFCSLSSCADGANPSAPLVLGSDGSFYGTTVWGGANALCLNSASQFVGCGTVFKVTPSGALTTLYSFCSQSACADGAKPYAGLVLGSDGNLYGTTYGSGVDGFLGAGTVFRISPSGELTTLYSFCSQSGCADGQNPLSGLVQSSDGNFYGTTTLGGAYGADFYGTIFKITPGGTLTTLYNFCSQPACQDGSYPTALILGNDGSFYGTTGSGGADWRGNEDLWYGTVFKVTPSGALTTLQSFRFQDGATPAGALAQGSDGNFYGTTIYGGANACLFADTLAGCGTIFKITPAGALTTIHNFDFKDGKFPEGGVIQGADGNFYGTTSLGGTHNGGTLFKITPASTTPAASLSPTSLSLGTQVINTSSTPKLGLTSSGSADLIISNITITGANAIDFAEADNCPSSLAPGASCTIDITWTPSTLGAETAILNVNDNASNSPQTVTLTGSGILPASLMPASAIYSSFKVGTTSAAKTFALFNNLSTTLDNITISTTGDFAVSATNCGASLAARSHCTINVTFTPTAAGTRTGTLSVTDGASNSPQTVSLTGTGK